MPISLTREMGWCGPRLFPPTFSDFPPPFPTFRMKNITLLLVSLFVGCVETRIDTITTDPTTELESIDAVIQFMESPNFVLVLEHSWSIESRSFAERISRNKYFSTPSHCNVGHYVIPNSDESLANLLQALKNAKVNINAVPTVKFGGADGAVVYRRTTRQYFIPLEYHFRDVDRLISAIEQERRRENKDEN